MRRLAALLGVMTAVAWGVVAEPAQATVAEQGRYAFTEDYTYNDCGYPVDFHQEVSGTYSIRAGKGDETSAFFLTEVSSVRQTHTRAETGGFFTVEARSVTKETGARHLEGDLFEFTTIVAGQPFTVRDSDGGIVLRDRGNLTYRTVWDTQGDDQPGGIFLEFLGAESHGPHPGFGADLCDIGGDLIGTGSHERLTARPAGTTAAPQGYYEYLPPGYGAGSGSPLLVSFNGFGENGDGSAAELPLLLDTGVPYYIDRDGWAADRPFVVLAPQHPNPADDPRYRPCDEATHGGTCAMETQHGLGHPPGTSPCTTPDEVDAFLDYAVDAYDIDPRRIYLTGLSCGAFGVWEYVADHGAERVAAVVPIAGSGQPAWRTAGCALGEVAIWAFHSQGDDVVDSAGSIEPLQALQGCPAPPRRDAELTVYPDGDHDAWSRTYSGAEGHDVYAWLLRNVN
ncbi:hypothetical protein AB0M28_37250 [Streptomyces sp. NPDC051940]|uniref:carboxylesterase family protein n=1 Tax=Streptomyces sp. NPDC051940 TaxID=3155675 RepID=UPI0034349829